MNQSYIILKSFSFWPTLFFGFFLLIFGAQNKAYSQELLRLTVRTVPLTCNGDGTGIIILGGQGGVPPYQFSLSTRPFGDASVFRNLQAGNYRARVRDARGSEVNQTVILNEPALLTWSQPLRVVQPTGCNRNDGSITASASGGTGKLTYTLNGRLANETGNFRNISGGTYVIRVSDINGCSLSDTVMLNDPALNIKVTTRVVKEPLCAGAETGEITITASGAEPPLEYSIDNVNYQPENVFTGLRGGLVYTVYVKTSDGCYNSADQILREPLPLEVKTKVTDPICDLPDGRIILSASGGTPPYRYSINGGRTYSADTLYDKLGYGPYPIIVRDANDCIYTRSDLTLKKSLRFETKLTVSQPSCALAKNGSIMVEILNGTGAFDFSIDGMTFRKSNRFDSLTAGRYTITIQNEAGCGDTVQVTLRYVNDLQFTTDIRYPDCIGGGGDAGNGTITVRAKGGKAPYRYSKDGVTFQSDSIFRNISAVPTFIYVLDANNCFTERYILLYPLANNLQFDVSVVSPTCFNAQNGQIRVTVTAGTGPYSYSLNGGSWQSESVFQSLSAGDYSVSVKGGNECVNFKKVRLISPVEMNLTAEIGSVSCPGLSDGNITLKVKGGTPPYRFTLVNPSRTGTDSVFRNLSIGSYEFTVRDASGCTVSGDTQIFGPELNVLVVQPGCSGTDGSVSFSVANPEGKVLYTFNGDTSSVITEHKNLRPGRYRILARLENGCVLEKTVDLVGESVMDVLVEGVPVSSCSSEDGSIIIGVNGGMAPVLFSLDNINFQFNNRFTGLKSGNYRVYIKDGSGCRTEAEVVVPRSADSLRISFIATNVTCPGGKNGSVLTSVLNGRAPFAYLWSDGSVTGDIANLPAGRYTLTVSDAAGCRSVIRVTLTQPPAFSVNVIVTDTRLGTQTGKIEANVSGATSPYLFSLNGSTLSSTNRFNDLDKGIYTLRIRDAAGCDTVMTVEVKTLSSVEPKADEVINIYPNPAQDYFEVKTDKPVWLIITDLNGKIIIREHIEGYLKVNVSDWPAGIFLADLEGRKSKLQIVR